MRKAFFLPLIAILPAFQGVPPEEPSRIVAVGEKFAVVMAPPETVASAYVEDFQWTGDGTTLLAKRIVIPDDAPAKNLLVARQVEGSGGVASLSRRTELVAWSPRTRKPRLLLAYDPETFVLGDLQRVPFDDRFYAVLKENLVDPATRRSFVRVSHAILDVGAGTLVRVPYPDAPAGSRLEFSPKGAVVLLQNLQGGRQSVAPVLPNGTLGRSVVLSAGVYFEFDASGATHVAVSRRDGNGRRSVRYHRLDLSSGIVGAVVAHNVPPEDPDRAVAYADAASAEAAESEETPPEIAVIEDRTAPGGAAIRLALKPFRLENSALVTLDGTEPLLSPKRDAVAYRSGGSLLVRTLTRLSLAEVAKARADAERERTIARGRQVSLALAMYAADADDALPPLSLDVREAIYPYVKSRGVFDGFVLEFGGDLPKEGLATFQVGYVAGPGGRVLLFADGSVRWQPDGNP